MIKRILVALDPDGDTPVATHYAVDIAARHEAEVSGLAIVDVHHIAAEVGPGGAIGAFYYAEQVRRSHATEVRAEAHRLTAAFDDALRAAGLRHGERVEEGVAFERIVEDMKYHDLLVLGGKAHFHYDHPDHETKTLARITRRGVPPALVVGDRFTPVRRVVVAFDGSSTAARTMQRFAQLMPFGRSLVLDVVSVYPVGSRRRARAAELNLRLAGGFLRAHGFERVVETGRDGSDVARAIMDHAEAVDAHLIVAGAHAVSPARRFAFGSTTDALLKQSTVPLFLYH